MDSTFFRDTLGSPVHISAPMVGCSELPFRMLVRRHGVDVCYTPMIDSRRFVAASPAERRALFDPRGCCGDGNPHTDRPLVAQLCATTAEDFVAGAELVQDFVDAVDINFGCPQKRARREGWGAALLDHEALACAMVSKAVAVLRVPVCCKMRLLPCRTATVRFAEALERAGCSMLVVHGRTRDNTAHDGPVDRDAIRAVVDALGIPVVANGGVRSAADAEALRSDTGCAAVMSATGLLKDPALFARGTEGGGTMGSPAPLPAFRGTADSLALARLYLDVVAECQQARADEGVIGGGGAGAAPAAAAAAAAAAGPGLCCRFTENVRDHMLELFRHVVHPKVYLPRSGDPIEAGSDGAPSWKDMAAINSMLHNKNVCTLNQFRELVELLAHMLGEPMREGHALKSLGDIKRGGAGKAARAKRSVPGPSVGVQSNKKKRNTTTTTTTTTTPTPARTT